MRVSHLLRNRRRTSLLQLLAVHLWTNQSLRPPSYSLDGEVGDVHQLVPLPGQRPDLRPERHVLHRKESQVLDLQTKTGNQRQRRLVVVRQRDV